MRTNRSAPRFSRTTASFLKGQRVPSKGARTSASRASRVMRCIGERRHAAVWSGWQDAQAADPA